MKPLNEYPLPVYYTFVFTDQDGHHLYAACLTFFEKVDLADLANVAHNIWGDNIVRNPCPLLIVIILMTCLLAWLPVCSLKPGFRTS